IRLANIGAVPFRAFVTGLARGVPPMCSDLERQGKDLQVTAEAAPVGNGGRALRLVGLLAALGLAACSQSPEPRADIVKAPPPVSRDLIGEVRAAGADAGDVIEVAPLRDPAIEDLLYTASVAERSADWSAADNALQR